MPGQREWTGAMAGLLCEARDKAEQARGRGTPSSERSSGPTEPTSPRRRCTNWWQAVASAPEVRPPATWSAVVSIGSGRFSGDERHAAKVHERSGGCARSAAPAAPR
jgi:hypothetical protein